MKGLLLILLSTWVVQASGQTRINGYEYWFDGQYMSRKLQSVNAVPLLDLQTSFSTTGMSEGLHVLNLRFRDDSGRWSPAVSQFFYRQPESVVPGNILITGYQYWFDQQYDVVTYVPVSPVPQVQLTDKFPAAGLSNGLHIIHLRYKDTRSLWSPVISQFVYMRPAAGDFYKNQITTMYYWMDYDADQVKTKLVSAGEVVQITDVLDMSSLPDGLHQLHVQFDDTLGIRSPVVSQFFYKSPATGITNNVITGYRYWFNSEDETKMVVHETTPQAMVEVNATIDMGCLGQGDNRLHLQYRDAKGLWSSALTNTVGITIPGSNIYRFTGNGNWSNTANWLNNRKPALDLPGCKEIIIDHEPGGVCVLDVPQRLLKDSKLTVLPEKHFVIPKEIHIK